jgi:hypothetical protein
MLDFRARKIQAQSYPSNAGTEQLAVAIGKHEAAAPKLPTLAATDAAGASYDAEIRGWLRSMPPVEGDRVLAKPRCRPRG